MNKLQQDFRATLRPFIGSGPRLLVVGALLACATVLMGMGLLGLSGWFISATALAGLSVVTALAFDVFAPSAGIRLLALGRTAARYGERVVTHDATFAVLAVLREKLFRGWARPGAARTLLARPSRLLFRLTADIDALETLYLRLLVPAVAAFGAALMTGIVLGVISPVLGIAVFVWLLAAGGGVTLVVARRARPAAIRRARALETLRAHAADLVAGQIDLVLAGRTDAQLARLERADRQIARADLQLHRLETAAGSAFGIAGSLTLSGVLLAAGALAGAGHIGAPVAALMLLTALTATEPFAALRRGALDSGRMWLAARRLAPQLRTEDQVQPAAAAAPAGWTAVSLTDVVATHPGSRRPALAAIQLRIASGQRVAIVGPSGAGKSTLMGVIAGELEPSQGLCAAQRHCLMTQRTELFQDSLRDNLKLAAPDADDARLWLALRAAGLEADARALPRGLDTMLGEGGAGLSGGQSRRLALARLLLRDVDLWLLDEPTEALDTFTAHDVLRRLALEARGKTLLIATHLRREAALADRLLVMRDGRIAADLRRGEPAFDAALLALRPD